MKSTMDKAGRVVIPKELRDRASLEPGKAIEIEFDRDHGCVRLSAHAPEGSLVRKDGLLMWESAPGTPTLSQAEIKEAIRVMREERKSS